MTRAWDVLESLAWCAMAAIVFAPSIIDALGARLPVGTGADEQGPT